MSDIELTNVSMRQKRGDLADLPESAPDGELLVVKNTDDTMSLYVGTGDGVAQISGGGGGSDMLNRIYGSILDAPSGIGSVSGAVVTFNKDLKMTQPNGLESSKVLKYNEYTLTSAKTTNVSSYSNGTYILFINNSGTVYKCPKDAYYETRTAPTVTSAIAVYYNIAENKYYITTTTGSAWTAIIMNPVVDITVASGTISAYRFYMPYTVLTRDQVTDALDKKLDSIIVKKNSHGFDNEFVAYNGSDWVKAYASLSKKLTGYATKINSDEFKVTIIGKIDNIALNDKDGADLTPGSYYYLCTDSSNAGKIQDNKPVGICQNVLLALSTTSFIIDTTKIVYHNLGTTSVMHV